MTLNTPRKIANKIRPFANLVEPGRVKRVDRFLAVIESGGDDSYITLYQMDQFMHKGGKVAGYAQQLRHKLDENLDFVKAVEGLTTEPADPLNGPTKQQIAAWKLIVKKKLTELDDLVWKAPNKLNLRQKNSNSMHNADRAKQVWDWMKRKTNNFYDVYTK